MGDLTAEVVIVGSGAGGAAVATTLAAAGRDVLLLEEGPPSSVSEIEAHSPAAMRTLYRDGGASAISARSRIAYVEGRCVGGSTEINSGFWHRLPPSVLAAWQVDYGLDIGAANRVDPVFEELEAQLGLVSLGDRPLPPSSAVFKAGLEKLGWDARETPRLQRGDPAASQFGLGAKSTMSVTFIPKAIRAGARLMSGCRVSRITRYGDAATGVRATVGQGDETEEIRVEADYVWVCGGTTQTPLLLRRSGIRTNVGSNLQIHPMVKVAAEFDRRLDAHDSVMPVFQIRDHASDVFIGGSVFTPGFLAMALADAGSVDSDALTNWRNSALFYVSVKSHGTGRIGTIPFSRTAWPRFRLSRDDAAGLTAGLVRLSEVLFEGGARRLFPGISGAGAWESMRTARAALSSPVDCARMRLSTVHLTSTCPIGENRKRCAADSRGKLNGLTNVYVGDASAVPGAPGVNPQGTVMALATINARRFADQATRG